MEQVTEREAEVSRLARLACDTFLAWWDHAREASDAAAGSPVAMAEIERSQELYKLVRCAMNNYRLSSRVESGAESQR